MVATVKDIMRMYVHYHKIKNGRLRIMGWITCSQGVCPPVLVIVGVLGGVLGSWGASSLAEYGMDKYYQK